MKTAEASANADDSRSFDSGGQSRAASAQDDNLTGGEESSAQDGASDSNERVEGFRAPGDAASTGELLKFLIDRTGYIKLLEGGRHAGVAGAHREPARTGERRHGFTRPR